MPSPIHQKYSSQTHRLPSEPISSSAEPRQDRRSSLSSAQNEILISSPPNRFSRRGSNAWENFAALKRPIDNPNVEARRASFADSRPKGGMFGTWFNSTFRGLSASPPQKEQKGTSTLSR
ncbi:hypothetical protein EJ05DRAFT_472465 [Pseudovirgaria hyperparasitica]|uniref:Conidiation-specific expression protein n=1 Tax=Pseudovirgaria hyperparasitica TaxID=470096 RepID=A0A6A6WMW8_9PEZI|nr:uncharacterized protein EJ05DRAFT_472465 [Pseudovirgaria hyperparasitica]KAF2763571.1 hypothetical protein EJ05DRAFT_472465 [Pseudovirgaria hyperparasitica]